MGSVSPRPILVKSPAAEPGKEHSPSQDTLTRPITRLSVSKSYTIPPRPKPGRKPNTDVPPSRRKAQNREAQRAFRERKSQAVRQLEEQLAKQAQAFERQQEQMRQQILMLQRQNMQLQYSPQSPQSPQSPMSPPTLQPLLAAALSSDVQPTPPKSSPRSPSSPFGTPVTPADFVGLELLDHVLEQKLPTAANSPAPETPRTQRRQSVGRERIPPPPTSSPLELVNTNWSQPAVPLRRNSRPLEVDFTSAFIPREPRPLVIRSPPAPKDRCGFCTDSSPCICAAAQAREEGISNELATDLGTLGSPPITAGIPSTGIPPSGIATAGIGSPSNPNSINSPKVGSPSIGSPGSTADMCTGNPDSCSQCRGDPMLTLFCSAVASKAPSATLSPYSTYIPAQAAYKTLSRHPRFRQADLGQIVETLQVRRSQVEVNSVAKALRLLDGVQ